MKIAEVHEKQEKMYQISLYYQIHVLSSTLSSVQGKGLMTTHWLEGEADQVPDLGLVTSRCDEAETED